MPELDLSRLTLEQAASALARRDFSPVDLLEATLRRVDATEPTVNALVSVLRDSARETARQADLEIAAGRYRGPLHGIPLAVKDLFDVVGSPTTASSKVRPDYYPERDAHVIALLKAAGAIPVAKAHTHEFAYGGITPQSHNPWDVTRITGGSSGGSAAAVATGEALIALGTDTAGSIRIPSSCCGVVGMKPTYGRVSKSGVVPLSLSLDHVGPITRTVRDAALALGFMAGHDATDPASSRVAVPDYLDGVEDGVAGLRIGLPDNYFFDHCSDVVVAGVQGLATRLEREGARLVSFTAPDAEIYSDVEFCIAMVEASAYHETMLKERGHLYLDHTRALLEAGESIPAVAYLRALRLKERVTESWRREFENFDVLLIPTLPGVAPRPDDEEVTWGDGYREPLDNSLTRLNCPHNLTGQPALTMRCGFDDALPFGAQFVGRAFDEATVFRVARAAERLVGTWDDGPFPTGTP
ncbi:MAG: amidase [Acidobacteriota bacterium]|nr:amidase [Acidobacteriota bacterium]